jgi:hypothetical protein
VIIDANNPATLAAQAIAAQRDGQQQRTDSAQQPAVDRAQSSARARADRANGVGEPQTRQSVSAPDTQDQRIASDRSAAERGVNRPGAAQSGDQDTPARPPAGSQRGTLVDVFA